MIDAKHIGVVSVLLVTLGACARSHERDSPDASIDHVDSAVAVDATIEEDAALDDPWLAEPCPLPASSCFTAERTDSWYVGAGAWANGIAALVAHEEQPFVLFTRDAQVDPPLGYSPVFWWLQSFDRDGIATPEQRELPNTYGSLPQSGFRGALAIRDGRVLAARAREQLMVGQRWYTPMGYESSVVEVGDEFVPVATVEEGEHDVALTAEALVVASTDDVAWFSLSNPDERVSLGARGLGKVVAASLGENATVVAWALGRVIRVVVIEDGEVTASDELLSSPIGGSEPVLIAVDGEIWLGRFVVNQARLRSSHIRVARLDRSLRRLERDRWFSGWGGLAPQGLAMVESNGAPLLLWTTVDTRFGAHTVLHARSLDVVTACGADVTEPALIWGRVLEESRLLAATSDDETWLVVPQVEDMLSADMYRLTACEPTP